MSLLPTKGPSTAGQGAETSVSDSNRVLLVCHPERVLVTKKECWLDSTYLVSKVVAVPAIRKTATTGITVLSMDE